jgi:translation initiation factor 3 subunit C
VITEEQVKERLAELQAARGKRGTDKHKQIKQLEMLVQFALSDAQLVTILMHLVLAQFDASPSAAAFMPTNLWRGECYIFLNCIFLNCIFYV